MFFTESNRSIFLPIWPNVICLAWGIWRQAEQTEWTVAQSRDSIRIQNGICNCSFWKVDVRGVRRRPLKSFATPIVPIAEVTFIQSSSWIRLLGRWLMRDWQTAEGHILWLVVHKNVWQGEVQTLRAECRWEKLNDHMIINQTDPEVILSGSKVRGY